MLNILEMCSYHRCEESLSDLLLSPRRVPAFQRNITALMLPHTRLQCYNADQVITIYSSFVSAKLFLSPISRLNCVAI